MKKIFIYYSYSGNGDSIAELFKNSGYEIRKVIRKKPLSKRFLIAMLKGGFEALSKKKAKLIDFDNDVSNYDEVVIGSPIWNGRISSPINTVLSSTNLKGKKLSFVLYAGGGEAPKAIKRIKKEYVNSEIIILKEPKEYKEELSKISSLLSK